MSDIDFKGDEADTAQVLIDSLTESGIKNIRKLSQPEYHPDFDGRHCVECDCEIPKARLDLGKVRCFDCQNALEKRSKHYH